MDIITTTKKVLALLFIQIMCCFTTSAQKRIAEFEVDNLNDDVQCIAAQDSLFLTYTTGVPNYTVFKSIWILPTGEIRNCDVPELKDKAIGAIRNVGDSTYFYYFEATRKNLTVGLLIQSKITGQKRLSSKKIKVEGRLVGVSLDRDLSLLTISKGNSLLIYTRIKNVNILDSKSLKLPKNFLTSAPVFVNPEKDIRSTQAAALAKAYMYKNMIVLSVDVNYGRKSTFLKWNLDTGETEMKDLTQIQNMPLRTLLVDDYVFKVGSKRGFHISILDNKTSTIIQSSDIDKTSSIDGNVAFFRTEVDYVVRTNRTVWDAVDNLASDCFISAAKAGDSTYILKIGSHETHPRSGGVPVISAFGPLVQLALLASRTAIGASNEEPSVDIYFYMKWDGKHLTYTTNPETIGQVIDRYETEGEAKNMKFKYKGYIYGPEQAYGLYQIKDKNIIQIIKFDKP
jgi:hypothetical protein